MTTTEDSIYSIKLSEFSNLNIATAPLIYDTSPCTTGLSRTISYSNFDNLNSTKAYSLAYIDAALCDFYITSSDFKNIFTNFNSDIKSLTSAIYLYGGQSLTVSSNNF